MVDKQKVIGYVRVSTEQQAEEGVSLEAQQLKIRTYCDIMDFELVGIEIDAGKSAKDVKSRPALIHALQMVKKKEVDAIIVTKIDRLSRSLLDMGRMVKTYFKDGEGLISIAEQINTGTATGRMFLNMIVMFSEYERELISERTKDAMAHLKEQNVVIGRAELGWYYATDPEDVDSCGRLNRYQDLTEQRTLRRIKELHEFGMSLRRICTCLTDEGYQTKRGGKWHPQTVKLIVGRVD